MISFVIRTYNEEKFLGRLFDAVESQAGVGEPVETVVVDSGSLDRTVEVARTRASRLIEIPKASFHYSAALNLGIEASRGDLVVAVSAHSIPTSPQWLSSMIRVFADARTAGAYCRQLPWPDAHWRERQRVGRMFPAVGARYVKGASPPRVPFSNAASVIRRAVWAKHPFTLPAAEDIEWATIVVAEGWHIVYESDVSVYHSHDESPRQGARRLIDLERTEDLQQGRRRTSALTARQAIGAVVRDWPDIRASSSRPDRRLRFLMESAARSYWFFRDFTGAPVPPRSWSSRR